MSPLHHDKHPKNVLATRDAFGAAARAATAAPEHGPVGTHSTTAGVVVR